MTTEEIKRMIAAGYQTEEVTKSTIQSLVDTIETSVSALATINPVFAASVLDDLAGQFTIEEAEELQQERDDRIEEIMQAINLGEEDE